MALSASLCGAHRVTTITARNAVHEPMHPVSAVEKVATAVCLSTSRLPQDPQASPRMNSLVLTLLVLTAACSSPVAGASASDVQVLNITLKHMPSTAQAVPVQFSVLAPASPQPGLSKLPVIFGLNGYNVEARDYLDVSKLLAQKGYPVVLSDYLRPPPPGFPPNFFPANCPVDQIQTSVALLATFAGAVANATEPLLKSLANRGTVLLAHSNGGAAAAVAMDGICANATALAANPTYQGFCEGNMPQFISPDTDRTPGKQATGTAMQQANDNSQALNRTNTVGTATILGAVLYEGYLAVPKNTSNPRDFLNVNIIGLSLPPGTFLAYLSGAYNNNTYVAYEQTKRVSPNNCVLFVRFEGVGHFGLCNPQPSGNEVTRCAVKASADPAGVIVPLSTKERAIAAIADSINAIVLSNVLKDQHAAAQLGAWRRETAVMSSSGGGGGAIMPAAVDGISQVLLSNACLSAGNA